MRMGRGLFPRSEKVPLTAGLVIGWREGGMVGRVVLCILLKWTCFGVSTMWNGLPSVSSTYSLTTTDFSKTN